MLYLYDAGFAGISIDYALLYIGTCVKPSIADQMAVNYQMWYSVPNLVKRLAAAWCRGAWSLKMDG